jgi:hypothetical protein
MIILCAHYIAEVKMLFAFILILKVLAGKGKIHDMHHVKVWQIEYILKEEKETPKEENSLGKIQVPLVFLYCFFQEIIKLIFLPGGLYHTILRVICLNCRPVNSAEVRVCVVRLDLNVRFFSLNGPTI